MTGGMFWRRMLLSWVCSLAVCDLAMSDTLSFIGGTGAWSTADNWASGSVPTAADMAGFTLVPGPATVLLTSDSNPAAGLVFTNPNSTLIRGEASNSRRLLIGAEGIEIAATAGEVTLGSSTSGNRLGILLQASQTWTNNRPFDDGDTLLWESGGGARIVLNGHALSFAGTGRTRLGHVIEGEGDLVINGGAVRLDGGNAGNRFVGAVTLNGGLLQFSSSSIDSSGYGPLGMAGNLFVINGGTLTPRGSFGVTRTVANPMVWSGDFRVAPPPDVDVQTLQMTGGVTLQGSRTVTVEGFTGIAVRSVTSGSDAAGITKAGRTGTLILEGTNTYLGTTTVSEGALAIESTAALPRWNVPGAFSVADGAALAFGPSFVPGGASFDSAIDTMIGTGNIAANAAIGLDVTEGTNTLVLSSTLDLAALVGTRPFAKSGFGSLALTGPSTYTGATRLYGGYVNLDAAETPGGGPLGSGGSIEFLGGALRATATNTHDYSARFSTAPGQLYAIDTADQDVTWAGLATAAESGLNKLGGGTLRLPNLTRVDGTMRLFGGTIDLGFVNDVSVGMLATSGNGPGIELRFGGDLTVGASDAGNTFSGLLTPTGSAPGSQRIEKVGTGTWTLSADQTYPGETVISGGSLQLGAGGSGGATGSVAGSITNNATLVFNRSNDAFHSGTISGAGRVVKQGTGTVSLTAQNTYSGGTTFAAGLVALEAVQTGATSGPLGGDGPLEFFGGGIRYGAVNTHDYSPRFTDTAGQSIRVDTNGQDVTWASAIDAQGVSLQKDGFGRLSLTGASTFGGIVTVNGGELAFPAGESNVVLGGLAGSGGTVSLAGNLRVGSAGILTAFAGSLVNTGSGVFEKVGTGRLNLSGDNSGFTGGFVLAGGNLRVAGPNAIGSTGGISFTGGGLQFTAENTTDYSSRFSQAAGQLYDLDTNGQSVSVSTPLTSPGGSLTKGGAGTLTLDAVNTFDGGTTLANGTLVVSLPGGLGAGPVSIGGNATLAFGAGEHTLAAPTSLTGAGIRTVDAPAGAAVRLQDMSPGPGAGDVILAVTGDGDLVFAGAIADGAAAGSTLGLVKTGAGRLILAGANTYTGPTTVSAGTLEVANAAALSGTPVTVDAAGQLALPQDARVAVSVGGLVVDEAGSGGRVDLGAGQVSIAAGGISGADLRADIIAGRAGGSWTGSSGITSSTAASSGGTRAVGYVVAADGSAKVSFAASGDVDLSGAVNVFDLVTINSSGKYGSGTASVWSQGDFNYDGVTNVFDLVGVNTAGAYGQGNYFPAAPTSGSLGSVAAVPEPGLTAAAIAAAVAGGAAVRRRRG